MLEEMEATELDVLVIGGGITGAGIALDAVHRGLRAGLVEMQDFAGGTSSRSTKLIHGGLRYLKQGEIGLVREVGREREILYRNAPHIVLPEWMLLPIVKGGTYGRFATSAGLWLYDYLAGVKRHERRRMLSKQETLRLEPHLREDGLIGSGYYVEYRTDDARLTVEVVKTAVEKGSLAVNYAKAEAFLYEGGIVSGAVVRDLKSGRTYNLRARKVVNAAGPWVDTLRELNHSRQGKRLHLTKGVHLVVDRKRAPIGRAVYFDTPDGRMIFIIPRGSKSYIGTTDTHYEGDLATPAVLPEDVNYLIRCVNHMFPTFRLNAADVESSWAGLRPLIHEDGKSPSELSRKDELIVSNTNLISIAGGKLTGFRKMAERVVNAVCAQLTHDTGRAYPACGTDRITLSGGRAEPGKDYGACRKDWIAHGEAAGLPGEEARKIVDIYGSNSLVVFSDAAKRKHEAADAGMTPALYASLQYSIRHEMAVEAEDYLNRRTGDAYFDIAHYRMASPLVARLLDGG